MVLKNEFEGVQDMPQDELFELYLDNLDDPEIADEIERRGLVYEFETWVYFNIK